MYIFKIDLFGITIAPTYYGLMYVLAFIVSYLLVKKGLKLGSKKMDDLLLYIFIGVILGGRIGYILFYDLSYYIENPLDLVKTWEGGMSFHGGVIGVLLAMYYFSKKYKLGFLKLADEVCYTLPIGLGLGRIGNYINKELLGFSPYDGPFSIYRNGIGYFPSPLLEALLEGVVLFLVLRYFYNKKNKEEHKLINFGKKINDGQIGALFLIFYSIFRIFVEVFFRIPDSQIGYIFGFLTMGEILTFPMFVLGVYYYIKLGSKKLT